MPVWLVAIIFTACGGGSASPAAPSTIATTTTSTGTTASSGSESTTTAAVAYVNDIKPILDSDCIVCHGPRVHENNVQLDTYANVMRVVQAGNANSLLVLVTRSNGIMYPNLTGDRAAKSELIRAWVVNNSAVETR